VAKGKFTKKELRHDAFSENVAKGYSYLQNNFLRVFLGIVLVAAGVLGTVYFRQTQLHSRQEAAHLMAQAATQYSASSYSECLLTLEDLIQRFGGRKEGKNARYFAGACHLALGENDAAIQSFRDYLEKDEKGFYALSAQSGLGLALEGAGQNQEALAQLSALAQKLKPADYLYAETCFAQARVLEKLGRREEAITVLLPLSRSDDFQTKQEANTRIQVLRAQISNS
jgi:predicted negative regulator of RcsB-dependent stress response